MSETKIHVTIVDDDDSFARALGRLLRASGFVVATYPSAETFLTSKKLPPPDCLVLDIQLGGMSGVELQQRLHEQGIFTPIIFVTAHDAEDVRTKARRGGCVAYLRKPVASQAVLEAVARALGPKGLGSNQ